MGLEVLTVRYPDGMTEFEFGVPIPEVGDTLRRGGDAWTVVRVQAGSRGSVVTLDGPKPNPAEEQAVQ